MKIAISATGSDLAAQVDSRFGRCQHFIVVDPDTMQFECVENTGASASGGAGIAAAQMIAGTGVKAVLTGNCGPKAYQVLAAASVDVVTGVAGEVGDATKAYKAGGLQASPQPSVPDHFGTGGVGGTGQGVGRSRGMGRG